MIYFILVACLGLIMFLGAHYLAQAVARSEPKLMAIEPKTPLILSLSMSAGVVIFLAGVIATIWTA